MGQVAFPKFSWSSPVLSDYGWSPDTAYSCGLSTSPLSCALAPHWLHQFKEVCTYFLKVMTSHEKALYTYLASEARFHV